MKWKILLILIIQVLLFNSCNDELELNTNNYKVVGKPGSKGLQIKSSGELALDTIYESLILLHDYKLDEYYVKYKYEDGRKGFYFNDLEEPTIEVGNEFKYLKVINSKKYFVFAEKEKNIYGYSWQGVIDIDNNIVIDAKAEQNNILHDGNKLFFICGEKDKSYQVCGLDGVPVTSNRYESVFSRLGITFASIYKDGGGDIWGAKGCFLDEEGNEFTSHDYQSVAVFQSLLDPDKLFIYAKKGEIKTLFYPNLDKIYKGEDVDIFPAKKGGFITLKEIKEKYDSKNIIGSFKKDGQLKYLTYDGEVIDVD